MKQMGLFDICENRHGGNGNSTEAFRSLGNSASEIRSMVFKFIESMGSIGATCDEIEVRLELSHQTASARCSELKRLGQIVEKGRRPTRSGRSAAVLVAPNAKCNFWDE